MQSTRCHKIRTLTPQDGGNDATAHERVIGKLRRLVSELQMRQKYLSKVP